MAITFESTDSRFAQRQNAIYLELRNVLQLFMFWFWLRLCKNFESEYSVYASKFLLRLAQKPKQNSKKEFRNSRYPKFSAKKSPMGDTMLFRLRNLLSKVVAKLSGINIMRFDIITIFPDIFKSFLSESLISRAIKKKLIKVNVRNLRDWAGDKHKTVDDRPFGGGFGMVFKIEPIFKAVMALKTPSSILPLRRGGGGVGEISAPAMAKADKSAGKQNSKTKVVLFTPRGKKFNQKIAYQLSKLDQVILICGRYEGVDERVAKNIADMEISIGDYDLMGGELPAMILIESVSRLIPGVLGKEGLLKERITKEKGFIEYPHYTRPEVFSPAKGVNWKTPNVLLSGDHKKIQQWREKFGKKIGN